MVGIVLQPHALLHALHVECHSPLGQSSAANAMQFECNAKAMQNLGCNLNQPTDR